MRKIQIFNILATKGYQIKEDFNISKGGSVYKYTEPSGATKRLYILESNIQEPIWGMNDSVMKRLINTNDNFMVILLSTANQESYLISKNEICNLYTGEFQLLSINESMRFIVTKDELCKLNSIHLLGNIDLANIINGL